MFRSPSEDLRIEILVWKLWGLFDTESDSPLIKKLFKAYVVITQALFIFSSFFLQAGAVFYANSIEEVAQILVVASAYANAACKAYVIASNRKNLEKLWAKLDLGIFKASEKVEMR